MYQDMAAGQPVVHSMRRRLAAALAVALFAVGVVHAAPAHANSSGCWTEPRGLIGERWRADGARSTYGCPTHRFEREVYENGHWRGRIMTFDRGEIAWSPQTSDGRPMGPNLVVSIRRDPTRYRVVKLMWGPTSPFHYDRFQSRWHVNGRFIEQREGHNGSRIAGWDERQVNASGWVWVNVQGYPGLQKWMIGVQVYVP